MDLFELFGRHDNTWMEDAKCANIEDPDIFFPPRDKELYKKIATEARGFCHSCPVQPNCLWYAVSSDENHGIWGGRSHRERNALVRKWKKQYSKEITLREYIFKIDRKEGYRGERY
jgi:WhiB family redox-sensing transcriptional regulator